MEEIVVVFLMTKDTISFLERENKTHVIELAKVEELIYRSFFVDFFCFARGYYFLEGLGAGYYPLHKPRPASVLIGFKSIPHKACLLGVRTKVETVKLFYFVSVIR